MHRHLSVRVGLLLTVVIAVLVSVGTGCDVLWTSPGRDAASTTQPAGETVSILAHPDCTRPCVQGIEAGRTTQAQAEQILTALNLSYAVRPLHIGGAGAYADQYDWANPTIIRVDGYHFAETRLTMQDDGVVASIFLAGGDVCPRDWFTAYGAPDWFEEDGSTLVAAHYDLGLTITFYDVAGTRSATLHLTHPDAYAGRAQITPGPAFPDDFGRRWTRSCTNWNSG